MPKEKMRRSDKNLIFVTFCVKKIIASEFIVSTFRFHLVTCLTGNWHSVHL